MTGVDALRLEQMDNRLRRIELMLVAMLTDEQRARVDRFDPDRRGAR